MSGQRARKYFGQHFLHDRNIIEKMLTAIAPQSEQHFVEIGPGRGALTVPLLQRCQKMDVIEIDRDLVTKMKAELTDPRLTIHQGDALKFSLDGLRTSDSRMRLVGNLPYNISSPLLFHFLDSGELFDDIHVMLQKEVVARMAAKPGNKIYGRLTVALAARCNVQPLFNIKPGSFTPPPRVESTFVRLTPDAAQRARINDEIAFDRIVRQAFNMRRKRLANALRGLITESQIGALGIDPDIRAEQLHVDSFIALGNLHADTAK
jgi:16S rRNA (adenine1518-N6/adenine1519-N6)-dimethyltransferase